MDILIALLVLALIVFVLFWVIDLLPLPHPIGLIAKVIIALIVLLKLLAMLGVGIGGGGGDFFSSHGHKLFG